MATTTPYGIYYPIASDSVAPLHTAFSTLADSVNTSLGNTIGPVIAKQQNAAYTVATVADMNAIVSPPVGATCFVTANQGAYLRNGTTWVPVYLPWTSYTPTAITGFTISAKYRITNNMVTVNAVLTRSGANTSGGLVFSLPLNSSAIMDVAMPVGIGTLKDASPSAFYNLRILSDSTSQVRVMYENGNPGRLTNMNLTGATPITLANGDTFSLNFTYPLD